MSWVESWIIHLGYILNNNKYCITKGFLARPHSIAARAISYILWAKQLLQEYSTTLYSQSGKLQHTSRQKASQEDSVLHPVLFYIKLNGYTVPCCQLWWLTNRKESLVSTNKCDMRDEKNYRRGPSCHIPQRQRERNPRKEQRTNIQRSLFLFLGFLFVLCLRRCDILLTLKKHPHRRQKRERCAPLKFSPTTVLLLVVNKNSHPLSLDFFFFFAHRTLLLYHDWDVTDQTTTHASSFLPYSCSCSCSCSCFCSCSRYRARIGKEEEWYDNRILLMGHAG